jgi:SanA protein
MRKLLFFLIISGIILMTPWAIVSYSAIGHVYRDIDTVPVRTYGLLLGTTPGAAGQTNLFFTTRIAAAQELYERGKIEKILVSGDNSTRDYNEPEYMRAALMKA